MSSPDPDLEPWIAALRSDLPSSRDRERVRSRLVSAGVGVSLTTVASTTAKAASLPAAAAKGIATKTVAASASVTAKLAGLSVTGKLGMTAALLASASVLSLAPVHYDDESRSRRRGDAPAVSRPEPAARLAKRRDAPSWPRAQDGAATDAAPDEGAPDEAAPDRMTAQRPSAPPRDQRGRDEGRGSAAVAAPRAGRVPAGSSAAVAVPRAGRAPAGSSAAVAAPRAGRVSAASKLRAEAEIIEHALTALHGGDLAAARRWLAIHAERFPEGALRPERERARGYLNSLPGDGEAGRQNGGEDHD